MKQKGNIPKTFSHLFPLSLSNLLSHSIAFLLFQFSHLNGVTYAAVKKGCVSMSPSAKQTFQTPLKSQLHTLTFVSVP